jgi:hypothetical protein
VCRSTMIEGLGKQIAGVLILTATVLGGVVALVAFWTNADWQLEQRLDSLETKVNLLLDHEGKVPPSKEEMEALYTVKANEKRIETLERQVFGK